ncbi:hypothetical protein L2E82_50597 [Cichorium intybus]|nr:hypothetical protein L2E82_50597 [Cichorium intybus]
MEAKDGKPSMGPVYRTLFAKDSFPPPIHGLNSCWDIFRGEITIATPDDRLMEDHSEHSEKIALRELYMSQTSITM